MPKLRFAIAMLAVTFIGTLPAWPATVALYAGQTNMVGTVTVANDATNLNITYTMNSGYLLREVHLAVACSLGGVPSNGPGNPVPGHFPFTGSYNPGVITQVFQIPLTDSHLNGCNTPGASPVIAAQAEVQAAQWIASGAATTVITRHRNGEDPLPFMDPSHAVTPFPAVAAWMACNAAANCPGGPYNPDPTPYPSYWDTSLVPSGSGALLHSAGARWIWESYHPADPIEGDVVRMETSFNVPAATAATVYIAADNGYEVLLNGNSIGSSVTVHTANGIGWKDSELQQPWITSLGWNQVYPLYMNLVAGANTFTVDAANEEFDTDDPVHVGQGTPASNPAGVIFLVTAGTGGTDTAWGNGTRFVSKGNWATYLTYTMQ